MPISARLLSPAIWRKGPLSSPEKARAGVAMRRAAMRERMGGLRSGWGQPRAIGLGMNGAVAEDGIFNLQALQGAGG